VVSNAYVSDGLGYLNQPYLKVSFNKIVFTTYSVWKDEKE